MKTIIRRPTRRIYKGKVAVGGGAPISVQSMCNTDTRDVDSTVRQIAALEEAGCEIVRVAVPDEKAASVLKEILYQISIPLIADIHFDYRLAIKAIEAGVNGLRINPGNIGGREKIERVLKKAKEAGIPVRIGVNSGSLSPELWRKFGGPTADALVESVLENVRICEEFGFENIVLSCKSSNVLVCVEAYRKLSQLFDYPLHIGITEAGLERYGTVKSAVGIGILLAEGIGDTIRVSLSANPVKEVEVAYDILKCLGLRKKGVEIISCPTCGRCEIDLIKLAEEVENKTKMIAEPIQIAVMGCVVNGPGEAREADFGIAGGKGAGVVFKKGEIIARCREDKLCDALLNCIIEELKKQT